MGDSKDKGQKAEDRSYRRTFHLIIAILLAIVVSVGLLLWTAPAQLLPLTLQRWFPTVQLLAVEGTLWHGRAGNMVVNLSGYHLPLGNTTWRLKPSSLLTLSPGVHITTQTPTYYMMGDINLSLMGQWYAQDVEISFPLGLLDYWLPDLVAGRATITLSQLKATSNRIQALDGVVDLSNIIWMGGDYPMPLGDYQALISFSEEEIQIVLQDIDALLAIEGLWAFTLDGKYRFDATLYGSPALAPEVMQTLQFFGKKGGSGEIIIRRSGVLP